MINYDLSQDLEVLLKDVSLDKGLLHFGFNTSFDLTQLDSVELLKIEFYKIYNRSNGQKYNIKFPRKKLVLNYVEILNNIEKPADMNNWYIKNQVGSNAVRTQRGFSEKVFSNNGFNPSIEKFVLSEKEIVSFEYPYYYLKDGYFWLLAQNLLTITNDQLFRFYFNLSGDNLEGISILLRFLLNEFDSRNISYRAKAPILNEQFNKADSFVLYVDKVHIDMAIYLIKGLQKDICIYLRDEIPLFTKEIFKGVGFAEEPQDDINQSFGKVKISEIIKILMKIDFQNSKLDSIALITHILPKIHEKFYLNKGSFYTESIDKILPSKSLPIKRNLDARPREIIEKSVQNIAYQLCSSAVGYDENQINWLVGTRNFKDLMSTDRVILKCSKNTFYNGKLGIGWFLVYSFQFSHDFAILKTCKLIRNNLLHELNDKDKLCNYFEVAYYLLETEKILTRTLSKEELDYYGLLDKNIKDDIVIKVDDFKFDPNNYYNVLWYLEILFSNVESLALNESGTVSKLESTIQDKLKSFYESLFNTTPVIDKNYSLIIRYCLCEKAIQLKKIGFEGYDKKAGQHLLERLKIIDTKFELVENIILMNSIDRLRIGPELRGLIEGRINNYFNTFNEYKSKPKSIGNALDYVLLNQSVETINVKLKYEKQNLWDSVSKDCINSLTQDFISNNIFPDLGLAQDFYNSGINEGIAGVGYLLLFSLLSKDELSLLPSHCFLDYSELQSPNKDLDFVPSDFAVPLKGNQSWNHRIDVPSKSLL